MICNGPQRGAAANRVSIRATASPADEAALEGLHQRRALLCRQVTELFDKSPKSFASMTSSPN